MEGKGTMGSLPEELWVKIVHMGLLNGEFLYRDLCVLALVSKRLNRISELDCVWKELLARDFREPGRPSTAAPAGADGSLRRPEVEKVSCKKLYRTRYEKVREKALSAHKRHVLRVTSSLNVLRRERLNLQEILQTERDNLRSSQKELEGLERTSRTSVALQIWQPQAITTRHEQVVQQIPVDLAARKNSIRLEIQVCKARIQCVEKSLKSYLCAIEDKQRALAGLTYNPSEDLKSNKEDFGKKHGEKRKSVKPVSQLDFLSIRGKNT